MRTCRQVFGPGYAQGGKECDEYPFATTYEACAQTEYEPSAPKENLSVLSPPRKDDGNAGNLPGQSMTLNPIPDPRRRRRRLLRRDHLAGHRGAGRGTGYGSPPRARALPGCQDAVLPGRGLNWTR